MRIFKSFKNVVICSAILSVMCFFVGIVISFIFDTPAGASVVLVNLTAFLLFFIAGTVRRKIL
jgi:zinc transport system permease protein